MTTQNLKQLRLLAAVVLVALVVAACAIRLRGDEGQTNPSAPTEVPADPLAPKIGACRSVTYEQKDALSECRKAWAEQRRRFYRPKAPALTDSGPSQADSSMFVAPKDESRLPPAYPNIPQSGKE